MSNETESAEADQNDPRREAYRPFHRSASAALLTYAAAWLLVRSFLLVLRLQASRLHHAALPRPIAITAIYCWGFMKKKETGTVGSRGSR